MFSFSQQIQALPVRRRHKNNNLSSKFNNQKVRNGGIFLQVERVTKTGTESDLIKHIIEMKDVKRNQAACLKLYCQQAESKNATTAVLQVDWSQSYRCFYQNEIYDAYWDRKEHQVSIFTAMMWHRGKQSMAVAIEKNVNIIDEN
ncbi:CLUMA_CG002882, isoform A [Clunio marinus]|uniref:CLUMA_CG002882, isoform A n=1 Tax=Clunio marinus TaxID=568069 RepID=A0A1J1HQH3_9DIPT|nr:CLUMA_CG002882, isoform A [Clunio marinus]